MCPVCMPPSGSSHVPGARGACQLLQGGEPAVVQAALGAMDASFCKAADKWPGSQANASASACGEGARAAEPRVGCRALARPPSQDTPQVRPCGLWRGIHAAQGPATVGGQGPVEMAVCVVQAGHGVRCSNHVASDQCPVQAERQTSLQHATCKRLVCSPQAGQHAFKKTAGQLSGAVSSPIAGPGGGLDAATEPPGVGSRRVSRAVRAPRPRLARRLT
ncbi:hypothetical protein FHT12_002517 [Xanthomonas campestris]|nr:hypothetical protein [Xanthomonas euroxanthea]